MDDVTQEPTEAVVPSVTPYQAGLMAVLLSSRDSASSDEGRSHVQAQIDALLAEIHQ